MEAIDGSATSLISEGIGVGLSSGPAFCEDSALAVTGRELTINQDFEGALPGWNSGRMFLYHLFHSKMGDLLGW